MRGAARRRMYADSDGAQTVGSGGAYMGDHFRVEVEALSRLLGDLERSQEDLRTALKAMGDTGPRSTGSSTLDHACDEFRDSWDDALKKISQGAERISEGLRQTKENYAATEQALHEAFSREPGGPSGSTGRAGGAR